MGGALRACDIYGREHIRTDSRGVYIDSRSKGGADFCGSVGARLTGVGGGLFDIFVDLC